MSRSAPVAPLAARACAWQRARVLSDLPPAIALPSRGGATRVRVRHPGTASPALVGADLRIGGASLAREPDRVPAVRWLLARELFLEGDRVGQDGLAQESALRLLGRLAEAGVVEPV